MCYNNDIHAGMKEVGNTGCIIIIIAWKQKYIAILPTVADAGFLEGGFCCNTACEFWKATPTFHF